VEAELDARAWANPDRENAAPSINTITLPMKSFCIAITSLAVTPPECMSFVVQWWGLIAARGIKAEKEAMKAIS